MLRLLPLTLFALVAAQPATAAPVFEASSTLSDQTLAEVRGTRTWQLTRSSLVDLSEGHGAGYLQWIGKSGRVQMDVWWSTVGSQLIAQSVRQAG